MTQHVCCVLCRETTAPTQIGPYKVPEGIVVWPMIYALQNSTHNWEEPQKFKPVSSFQTTCKQA
jgi:cytochrome P450